MKGLGDALHMEGRAEGLNPWWRPQVSKELAKDELVSPLGSIAFHEEPLATANFLCLWGSPSFHHGHSPC